MQFSSHKLPFFEQYLGKTSLKSPFYGILLPPIEIRRLLFLNRVEAHQLRPGGFFRAIFDPQTSQSVHPDEGLKRIFVLS
jgi:hypothetical protein